jgi:Flp pilus assembly protein TadD
VVFFALGLLAKSQIVTLPFVLLLWDYWPLRRMAPDSGSTAPATLRSFAYLVWEKLPLFVLAAADSLVTMLAQRAGASVRTLAEVPWSVRLENVFVSYVRYIGKAFWPSRLVPMYPRPESSLPPWQVVGAVGLLLLVSLLVLRWPNRRYLAVGWFWCLGTLVPMIGIVTVGEQAMADRYAYIPFIGLFVALVWALRAVASRLRLGAWLASTAVLVVLVMGCFTYRQIGYWRDSETLWRYTLSVTERNYVAHSNLGLALAKLGRPDEAILHFRKAKALHKYSTDQILALGFYELHVGQPQLAIEECNEALRVSGDPKVQAAAWGGLGHAYLELHHLDLAAESYEKALRLNPEDGGALVGTGLLALRQGQSDLAVAQFFHAVRVDPTDANVLLYAEALRRAGRIAEADSVLAQVRKVAADFGQAQFDGGQFLSFVGLKPL